MRVVPLAKKFSQADKALATAPDTSAASAADQALRAGLGRFKQAVVPIKTQTPNAKLAKKVLLKAIREFDLGLVQYQVLLDKVNARREQGLAAAVLRDAQQAHRRGGEERAEGPEAVGARLSMGPGRRRAPGRQA